MNILLISRCPPLPLHLGDRLILYHLARELSARGHTLDLLAFDDRPDVSFNLDDAPFFRRTQILPAPRRGLPQILSRALYVSDRFPQSADAAWSPQMWTAVQAWLADGNYDLAHMFGGVQVYEFAHAVGSLPALITPYESFALYLEREAASLRGLARMAHAVKLWMARRYERFMFQPYARTVVVSDRDSQTLRDLNPSLTVDVIPNGIDLDYFTPVSAHDPDLPTERDLLFVGNYEYAPNADAALRLADEILPRVRQALPHVRLWLVGHAPTDAMRARASDAVRVTGRVDDVRPYLASAGAFVCPLTFGAGIKNKVLEALAMRCAVVCTPLSVDGIEVRHDESAVIAVVSRMPDAVIRVLSDSVLRDRLRDHGRSLIERTYTWNRVASRYETLYKAIIPRSAGPQTQSQ